MGCICSKIASNKNLVMNKSMKSPSKELKTSSKKEEIIIKVDHMANGTPMAYQKNPAVFEKPKVQTQISSVFSVRNGVDAAQEAAGWPSWLTSAAGEAIKGWIPRKADSFEKLDKIGQGTYSSVYKARDLEKGKIVALKKVRFVNMDPASVRFMAREIHILRRLDHPNVMKLEGLVTSRVSGSFYLVFEYMEHDLAGLGASPDVKFTEPQIKCYMKQLLSGLEHCHNRGVLHRDIKGSNLLIDGNGNLKIGDFGLATFYRANQTQSMTSRVVTLWYRPPELLLGSTNYGVAVDLWSSGCVLAELLAGKNVMPGRTEVEQLHKIFKLCGSPSEDYWKKSNLPNATMFKPQLPYKRSLAETYKDFPRSSLTLLDSLLAFEPELRGSTTSALQSEFFTSKPLPCDPSSLPKYPPSKEYDAKLRDHKQRKRAEAGKKNEFGSNSNDAKESKAKPASDVSSESSMSIQTWQERVEEKPKSITEKYNLEVDGGSSNFRMQQPRKALLNSLNRFGASTHVPNTSSHIDYSTRSGAELRPQRSYKYKGAAAARLSKFSNSVAHHNSSQFDLGRRSTAYKHWAQDAPLITRSSYLGRPKDDFLEGMAV
ncbi:hypothetical protein Leryth_004249 [Lithospermum erythrorhizon]|nr:hypothetical protein Leryth_004249 [Lithospermum erythrorhizon]